MTREDEQLFKAFWLGGVAAMGGHVNAQMRDLQPTDAMKLMNTAAAVLTAWHDAMKRAQEEFDTTRNSGADSR